MSWFPGHRSTLAETFSHLATPSRGPEETAEVCRLRQLEFSQKLTFEVASR